MIPSVAVTLASRLSRPTLKRVAMSVLAVGAASSATFMGSQASWTAQTQNAGNSVAAGTMSMTNDKNASSIFGASNIKPGDSNVGSLVIANTGSIPMAVSLTQDAVVNNFAANSMLLQVHDDTRNWCYYPTSASGACGAYGDWTASTLAGLSLKATDGSAKWPAAEQHTFSVGWKLATTSPNADQGKTASFRLTWDGIQ